MADPGEPPLTVGQIARQACVPLHKVTYAIRSRRIEPDLRAGILRLYTPATARKVVEALQGVRKRTAAR